MTPVNPDRFRDRRSTALCEPGTSHHRVRAAPRGGFGDGQLTLAAVRVSASVISGLRASRAR